jgi:hypothetical protein
MVPEDELNLGDLRLLEVDNRIVLPVNTHIRVLVTAADVLHSWAIPSLGIKLDACTGRLNQTSMFVLREGVFYGQCSEICWRRDNAVTLLHFLVVEGVLTFSVFHTTLCDISRKKVMILIRQRYHLLEAPLTEIFVHCKKIVTNFITNWISLVTLVPCFACVDNYQAFG